MSGIIITEMENIDEELSEKELERLNFKKLREAKQTERAKKIEADKKADEQKQNTQKQTGVSVTNTPNGTVTTKIKTEEDGSKTEETEEVDSNVDDTDSEKDTGFDSDYQKDETKRGVDTSDIKDGKEENIPDKPDKPLENAEDASKNRNAGNGLKQGEHCSTDEQFISDETFDNPEQNIDKELQEKKLNCTDPDSTGLNDLQKEILWVAIDMLKWQPTSDKEKSGSRKRKWEKIESKPGGDPFYAKYEYPNDPSFGMHSDVKGFSPIVRLKKLFAGAELSDASKIKGIKGSTITTHWCAELVSVIYMFAMASLKVKHKDVKNEGNIVCLNKYKDNPSRIPFKKHARSETVATLNARTFNYNVSWEPTVGSIFFRSQTDPGNCGHAGIVLYVTEDKGIVTIEGNAGNDCHIKYYSRSSYYASKSGGYHNKCGVGNKLSPASKIAPPFPTKSIWHELFINPSISTNLEWTEKVSRPENPLIELKSLLGGFYNPTGKKGADIDLETD